MTCLTTILADHGYRAPFSADIAQPGTIRDARDRPIPFLIVPGAMGCDARRAFSAEVAKLLNAEAAQAGEREAA